MSNLANAIKRAKAVLKAKSTNTGTNTIIITTSEGDHKDGALTIVLYQSEAE